MGLTILELSGDARIARKLEMEKDAPVIRQAVEPGEAGQFPAPLHPEVWPRSIDYRLGVNRELRPRQGEAVTFKTLRNVADKSDLVRIAIQSRKDQIRGLEWDITVQPGFDPDKLKDRRAKIRDFFINPDPLNDLNFHGWIGAWLEDLLVIDAATLYIIRDRAGRLVALPQISGDTIKPLLDKNGFVPRPPLPAYAQFLSMKGQATFTATKKDMIYSPINARPNSPYGMSPVEMVILAAHISLRRELSHLDYYTEGTVPDYLLGVPPEWTSAQIMQVQKFLDDYLSGHSAARRKMKLIPGGMEPHAMKQPDFSPGVDEWLARIIAAVFGTAPHVLLRQRTKQQAGAMEAQQSYIGLDPLKKFTSEIFTQRIIKQEFREPGLKFTWMGDKKEREDIAQKRAKTFIDVGVVGIDEVRQKIGEEALGIPPYIKLANGILFLTKKVRDAIKAGKLDFFGSEGGKSVFDEPEPAPPVSPPVPGGNAGIKSPPNAKKILAENELGQWRRAALSDLTKGRSFREFSCHYIDAEIVKKIKESLVYCSTVDAVKKIFREVEVK